jgi:hypothetical protein
MKYLLFVLAIKVIQSITQDGIFILKNVLHSVNGEVLHQNLETPYTEDKAEESLNLIINSVTLGDPEFEKPQKDYKYLTLQVNLVSYLNKSTENPFTIDIFINGNLTMQYNTTDFNHDENSDTYHTSSENVIRRNYFGTQVIKLTKRVDSGVYIKITQQLDSDVRLYFKEVRLYVSNCHPSCLECDAESRTCLKCNNGSVGDVDRDQCVCGIDSYKSYSMDMSFTCRKRNEYPMCQAITSNKFQDYCTQCRGLSIHKTNLDSDYYSTCICPPNHIISTVNSLGEKCVTLIDKVCESFSGQGENSTMVYDFLNNLNNFALILTGNLDEVFPQMYIKVNLFIQNYPDYSKNPVTFKIELKRNILKKTEEPSIYNIRNDKTYIYNSYFPYEEINYKGGLNINIEDVVHGLYDCDSKNNIIYACNIWVTAYHPCNNTIYTSQVVTVSFSHQGIIQNRYSLNPNITIEPDQNPYDPINSGNTGITAPKDDIGCIKQGLCFYNYNYDIEFSLCDNYKCTLNRTLAFQPNDEMYIRTRVYNIRSMKVYNQTLENAVYIIRDSSGNDITRFDVTSQVGIVGLSNGVSQIQLYVPDKTVLMDNKEYLEGASLNLALFIRVGEEKDSWGKYVLAPVKFIEISLNPDFLVNGKMSTYKSENTAIAVLSFVIVMLLIVIVVLVFVLIRVRRKYYSVFTKESKKVVITGEGPTTRGLDFKGDIIESNNA